MMHPVHGKNFNDIFFEFGKNIIYFVRTISLGSQMAKSLRATIQIKSKQFRSIRFSAELADSLTIAARPKNLSIFFALNAEKDVVGYDIYRTTDNPNLNPNGNF